MQQQDDCSAHLAFRRNQLHMRMLKYEEYMLNCNISHYNFALYVMVEGIRTENNTYALSKLLAVQYFGIITLLWDSKNLNQWSLLIYGSYGPYNDSSDPSLHSGSTVNRDLLSKSTKWTLNAGIQLLRLFNTNTHLLCIILLNIHRAATIANGVL